MRSDLFSECGDGFDDAAEPESAGDTKLAQRVAAFEKAAIEAELARHDGALKPVYEALGISRKGLYDKIKRHGIVVDDVG